MFSGVLIFISIVVFVLLSGAFLRLYQKKTNAKCVAVKDLTGKTVIVTGGTAGMGLEVAMQLAGSGAKVIIAGPDETEGIEARNRIADATGGTVIYKHLDLSSLASVRRFSEEILETEHRLDILVNNAGVLVPPDAETADGMNFVMQVNYYGHFLLTLSLLPLMKETGTRTEPSRIINTSSVTHRLASTDIENFNRVGYWCRWRTYSNSKLAMAMFTTELSKRLGSSHVVVNSVDPGVVGTRIYHTCRFVGPSSTIFFGFFFKTPLEGAQTALQLALHDDGGKINGGYFKNCKLSRADKSVYDKALCQKLWDETARLVHFDSKSFQMSVKKPTSLRWRSRDLYV